MPNCEECDKVFHLGCIEALAQEMEQKRMVVCQCVIPAEAVKLLYQVTAPKIGMNVIISELNNLGLTTVV